MFSLLRRWPPVVCLGLVLSTGGMLLLSEGLLAGPPPGKGGGGGGGDGSGGLTNPAFVYRDTFDGGLFMLSSDGQLSERLTKPDKTAVDRRAAWSPNGEWLAFFRQPDAGLVYADLYVIRVDGSGLTLIRSFDDQNTPLPADYRLAWTPDGTSVVYASYQSLWMVDLDDGALTQLVDVDDGTRAPNFSPDFDPITAGYQGYLAFHDSPGDKRQDVWQLEISIDLDGTVTTGAMQILTDPDFFQRQPTWSPDGRWLAFVEFDDDLNSEIMVMSTADGSVSRVAATHTNTTLTWSPDSTYIGFDNEVPGRAGRFQWDIFRVQPDGTGLTNVTDTSSQSVQEAWPDWNPIQVSNTQP